jgi:hypothetical protein
LFIDFGDTCGKDGRDPPSVEGSEMSDYLEIGVPDDDSRVVAA